MNWLRDKIRQWLGLTDYATAAQFKLLTSVVRDMQRDINDLKTVKPVPQYRSIFADFDALQAEALMGFQDPKKGN